MKINMRAAFIIASTLVLARPAYAESAEVMLSACRPIAKAEITGDKVKLPQDFSTGMCWGAFGVLQEVIRHMGDNKRTFKAEARCSIFASTK